MARAADTPDYKQVKAIIAERCAGCHSETPEHWVVEAPDGIKYDTADEIRFYAAGIDKTAVTERSMPPNNNATAMTEAERAVIGAWFAAGAKAP